MRILDLEILHSNRALVVQAEPSYAIDRARNIYTNERINIPKSGNHVVLLFASEVHLRSQSGVT